MSTNNAIDDRRSLIVTEIMTPDKANFAGNIHGGHLLALFDKVAYACAARYSGHYCVTLAVESVLFKQPVQVGELVTCYANINYVGHSSMEVGIKVMAESLETSVTRHTTSCFITMVAMDKTYKPIAIRPLSLQTPTQIRRFKEATLRREIRQKAADEHAQHKALLKKELHE